ncbi:acetyl-CoA C-acetyltransferase [Ruminococcaceae bacterium OttesenSCG-928-A16]|nr:acetyl-CoA C-acetyltransferase [Ruminococcaceae bacterium OttesenSCG-928-A16]
MKKVYIASAKRSPVGSFNGALSTVAAPKLAAQVIKNVLAETGVPVGELTEVICGNILPAGLGQGPARQAAMQAGIPQEVPAYSLNIACGSGMKAVMNAAAAIKAGLGEVFVAGGMENMSMAPYLIPEARQGLRMGNKEIVDHMVYDALTDAFHGYHMGVTAENVAERYGITREAQDEFAIQSQQKAIAAQDAGAFKNEIVPITVKGRKEDVVVAEDEYINRKTSLEKLASLRPAFKKEGTVTAGNASGINDGAAFMLVASEEAVKKYGLQPIAELVAFGQGGVDPAVMGLGPVPAVRNALAMGGYKLADIDLIELNEAFAAQSLGVVAELASEHGMEQSEIMDRTNVNGGAIALGHPVGASGARIMVTLAHLMQAKGKTLGLASLCIGGGMGTAVILKKCN